MSSLAGFLLLGLQYRPYLARHHGAAYSGRSILLVGYARKFTSESINLPDAISIYHIIAPSGLPFITFSIIAYFTDWHFAFPHIRAPPGFSLYHFPVPTGLPFTLYYRIISPAGLPFSTCYLPWLAILPISLYYPLRGYHFRVQAGLPFLNLFLMLDFPLARLAY